MNIRVGKKTASWKESLKSRGFTIVEILVVITVVGVVAGISVVSYGAWRKDIATDQVISELNGVSGAMENARNFGSTYPTAIPTTFKPTEGVTLTYSGGDGKTYCIQGVSKSNPSIVYHYDVSEKKEPQVGAC